MKWYAIAKYIPACVGDNYILRLRSGVIQTGMFDYQIAKGYFFSNEDIGDFDFKEITHFALIEPLEVEQEAFFVSKTEGVFDPVRFCLKEE